MHLAVALLCRLSARTFSCVVPNTVCKCICLKLCSGHDMMCTATQDDGQTTYTIPELPRAVHGKDSQCVSAWSNASDIVIANHLGLFLQPVISSSFSTLVTSKCIGNVTFSGTCTHKGIVQDYTASCSTSCAAGALIEDKGNFWIAAVAVVLFLLLAFLLLFLCCRKYQTWRKCCCSQTGGFYTAVKFQKGPQAADV